MREPNGVTFPLPRSIVQHQGARPGVCAPGMPGCMHLSHRRGSTPRPAGDLKGLPGLIRPAVEPPPAATEMTRAWPALIPQAWNGGSRLESLGDGGPTTAPLPRVVYYKGFGALRSSSLASRHCRQTYMSPRHRVAVKRGAQRPRSRWFRVLNNSDSATVPRNPCSRCTSINMRV